MLQRLSTAQLFRSSGFVPSNRRMVRLVRFGFVRLVAWFSLEIRGTRDNSSSTRAGTWLATELLLGDSPDKPTCWYKHLNGSNTESKSWTASAQSKLPTMMPSTWHLPGLKNLANNFVPSSSSSKLVACKFTKKISSASKIQGQYSPKPLWRATIEQASKSSEMDGRWSRSSSKVFNAYSHK